MASKNFSGYLREPLGEYAEFDKWTFTHVFTTGETVAGSTSVLNVSEDGFYNINIEYGIVNIRTRDTISKNTINQGTYVINSETLVTTLPALLNAEVPVSDPIILQMESILADTEAASDIAVAAASQITAIELTINTAAYPVGTVLTLSGYSSAGDGGGARWRFTGVTSQTLSQSPAALGGGLINDAIGNQWEMVSELFVESLGCMVDGSDDTLSFQACVNHAKSKKTTITQSSKGAFSTGNIDISSMDGVIFSSLNIKLLGGSDSALISGTNVKNTKFINCVIDGNAENQTPLGTEGNGDYGLISISGAGTENVSILNNKFINSFGAGAVVNDGYGTVITGNTVEIIQGHGIQVAGDTVKAIISGNTVDGIDEGAGIIPMGNAKYVTVSSNNISNVSGNGGDAITCYSDTNSNISIVGNIIKSVNGHGIHCGGDYLSVVGNVVSETTAGGIYVKAQSVTSKDVSVTGNSIDNSTINDVEFGRHGIHVNTVSGFVVSGNSINNGQDSGLRLKSSSVGSVTGNKILNSEVNGIRGELSSSRITYTGNIIKDTGGSGMLFDDCDQSVIQGNFIEAYSTVSATGYGLEITAGNLMDISGNSIRKGVSTIPTNNHYSSAATLTKAKDNLLTTGTSILSGLAVVGVTTTIPQEFDFVVLNGASAIETIDTGSSYNGRTVTFQLAGGVSLLDGVGNLKLNGDYISSGSTGTISLVCVGSTWLESSRSKN